MVYLNHYFIQFEDKCSDLRQRLRQASQNKGRHYANVYYLSGDSYRGEILNKNLSLNMVSRYLYI